MAKTTVDDIIRAYFTIIEFFQQRSKNHYTLKQLHDYLLAQDFDLSIRTLQRYLKHINEYYGPFIIEHEQKRHHYQINRAYDDEIATFLRLASLSMRADFFGKVMLDKGHFLKYFMLEFQELGFGRSHLMTLIDALAAQLTVDLEYKAHFKVEPSVYKGLHPYYLKEYQGRWYLLALKPQTNEVRTFALDQRMRHLAVNREHFDRSHEQKFEPFQHTVGLNYDEAMTAEPYTIKLQCSKIQAEYLRAVPLHHSQTEFTQLQTETHVVFGYRLYPNYELFTRILMMGREVKLLSPPELVDEFKFLVGKIHELYYP